MNYLCFDFIIGNDREQLSEILVAELASCGFEMFEETDSGVKAFVQKNLFDENAFREVQILNQENTEIRFELTEIPYQNWNKEWESNFNPVVIAGKVSIRAEFHEPNNDAVHEIIIQPEMSFGTGHHETTSGVIELMLDIDFKNKTVCDMGCGTAILAIMAEKLGAVKIDAVDIDSQCVINSITNIARNNCKNISVSEGDAHFLEGKTYDAIIANINRNILLNDMTHYSQSLNQSGILLLSGFYSEDLPAIEQEALKHQLKIERSLINNNWCAAAFKKSV